MRTTYCAQMYFSFIATALLIFFSIKTLAILINVRFKAFLSNANFLLQDINFMFLFNKRVNLFF